MERITSKLTRVLVITLLSAATMTAQNPCLDQACQAGLAARGAVLTNKDPVATMLRNQQPEGPARRGFDIGMAAAEGQTLPGPGKQAIHDSLSPAEQPGFASAVTYSLNRNRNPQNKNNDLAARGAVLADQWPWAAALRNQRPEGSPARRGFEIGLAAAEGQTEHGPGKQAIRATLTPAEQSGFDVAVSTSLDRNKNPEMYAEMPSRGADMPREDVRDAEPGSSERERPVRRSADNRSLRATLEHLREARELLEAADPDRDGQLEKAIDHTNKAIEALKKALPENH